MVRARGEAAVDCAGYTSIPVVPSCRQLSTNSVAQRAPEMEWWFYRGSEVGNLVLTDAMVLRLMLCLSGKDKLGYTCRLGTPSHGRPAASDRVGCHAWQQLGGLGVMRKNGGSFTA